MSQTNRAPNAVAKHFFEKYGRDEAVEIISSQITSEKQKQDSDFWLDVLRILDVYDGVEDTVSMDVPEQECPSEDSRANPDQMESSQVTYLR